jgi:hypothetical protein
MQHYLQGPGGDPPPADLDYGAVKPPDTDEQEDGAKDGAKDEDASKE